MIVSAVVVIVVHFVLQMLVTAIAFAPMGRML